MDTSKNLNLTDFSLSIADMREGFHEDVELADKVVRVIHTLIQQLKPVLRYVATPILIVNTGIDSQYCCARGVKEGKISTRYVRAVEIGKNSKIFPTDDVVLFLREDGEFFSSSERECCTTDFHHYHFQTLREKSWEDLILHYPINQLIDKLQRVFDDTKEKREKHLASIAERSDKLDRIMEILES